MPIYMQRGGSLAGFAARSFGVYTLHVCAGARRYATHATSAPVRTFSAGPLCARLPRSSRGLVARSQLEPGRKAEWRIDLGESEVFGEIAWQLGEVAELEGLVPGGDYRGAADHGTDAGDAALV